MINDTLPKSEERFQEYLSGLAEAIGHADRTDRLHAYCAGLLLPGERKSVEPMAARLDPAHVPSLHQALHHFVAVAPWDDQAVLAAVRAQVLPALTRQGPILAWIIDDTGFPKKGRHSVGVARQYCGQIGKQDNCQVAVSLSVATDHASLPIAFRLYLPEAWARDAARRAKAGIPNDLAFQTKPAIALDQIRAAVAAGLPPGVVVMDAGYGTDPDLREGVSELGRAYVAGIQSSLTVWPPGVAPLPPKPWSGTGRPPKLLRRAPGHDPVSAGTLARGLPPEAWRTVTWREGTNAPLASRFAAVRVRPAPRDTERAARRAEERLLVEWPEDEDEPTKYWLSTLPATLSLESLVETAKLRWRIERDYLELKQELGLGHYEGRGWRGFHHHATLCIAAYGFLVRERAAIPPCAPARAGIVKVPDLSKSYRPRGSPAAA